MTMQQKSLAENRFADYVHQKMPMSAIGAHSMSRLYLNLFKRLSSEEFERRFHFAASIFLKGAEMASKITQITKMIEAVDSLDLSWRESLRESGEGILYLYSRFDSIAQLIRMNPTMGSNQDYDKTALLMFVKFAKIKPDYKLSKLMTFFYYFYAHLSSREGATIKDVEDYFKMLQRNPNLYPTLDLFDSINESVNRQESKPYQIGEWTVQPNPSIGIASYAISRTMIHKYRLESRWHDYVPAAIVIRKKPVRKGGADSMFYSQVDVSTTYVDDLAKPKTKNGDTIIGIVNASMYTLENTKWRLAYIK